MKTPGSWHKYLIVLLQLLGEGDAAVKKMMGSLRLLPASVQQVRCAASDSVPATQKETEKAEDGDVEMAEFLPVKCAIKNTFIHCIRDGDDDSCSSQGKGSNKSCPPLAATSFSFDKPSRSSGDPRR